MRRARSNAVKKRVEVKSQLRRLGSAVAKGFLVDNGVPIDEDWTLSRCLNYLEDNKDHYDRVDKVLNKDII